MKTPVLLLILGAATLIHAGMGAETNPYDDIVKRYDKNGDGKLSEEEKVAAKEAMAMQDRPGAGRLRERAAAADPAQRAKQLENARARIEQAPGALRRYDKNGNGKLDDDEWAMARAQIEQRAGTTAPAPKGGKAPEPRGKMLQEFDKNGDGSLDETERAAMAQANRARAESNPRVLRRFDKDRDGKLSDAEWTEARTQLGQLLERRKDQP